MSSTGELGQNQKNAQCPVSAMDGPTMGRLSYLLQVQAQTRVVNLTLETREYDSCEDVRMNV